MQTHPSMRVLDAVRIADALPVKMAWPGGCETYRVHSVYRSAVNIAGPAGLVTVAVERTGGLPNGILVAGSPDFRSLGIRPGMAVHLSGDRLEIGVAQLLIRLDGAVPWSSCIAVGDGRAWRGRSSLVHALSRSHRVGEGLAAVDGARPAFIALAEAIGAEDRRSATAAADRLIGRGPGLTPSGDDALAGAEAALHALSHPVAGFLAPALVDVDRRTTTVSAALLRHAAHGEFAERIHRLIAVLLAPASGDQQASLEAAIEMAVAWGATSGSDMLEGVLLGLDAAAAGRTATAAGSTPTPAVIAGIRSAA